MGNKRSNLDSRQSQRGKRAYHSGHAAEEQVARHYASKGAELLETCWRGKAGEIDLIFRQAEEIVFVEVKSSRDFARAAQSLRPDQISRISKAAEEYCGALPTGLLTPMRIDVALLDQTGRIEILDNAIGH